MIEYLYTEDINGPLIEMPDELIGYCRRDKMANYNITPLAGILFHTAVIEEAKSVLEIGTGWCLSTIAFAAAMKITGGKVLSFDIHDRDGILATMPGLRDYITQINIDSHKINVTTPIVHKHFEEVDILFIDGDHSYDGVKQDFENYTPLLSKSGIVILHDIALSDPDKGADSIEVCRFWNEIDESKYNKFPFYASNGLGLIRKK
jgi:predicted O-methyltransferase YrrM